MKQNLKLFPLFSLTKKQTPEQFSLFKNKNAHNMKCGKKKMGLRMFAVLNIVKFVT